MAMFNWSPCRIMPGLVLISLLACCGDSEGDGVGVCVWVVVEDEQDDQPEDAAEAEDGGGHEVVHQHPLQPPRPASRRITEIQKKIYLIIINFQKAYQNFHTFNNKNCSRNNS